MVRSAAAGLVLAISASGCEGLEGAERLRRSTVTYESADRGFRAQYLAPPWEVVHEEDESLELQIPPEFFGVPVQQSKATHVFTLSYVDTDVNLDKISEDVDIEDIPEGQLPEYLAEIDLLAPGAVAIAELNHLLVEQDAALDQPLQPFVTDSRRDGIVYQVIIDPGVFIRVFYFPSETAVVRAAFASVFNLESSDIEEMVETIDTRVAAEEAP